MNFKEFYLMNEDEYLLEYTYTQLRNMNAPSVIRRRSNNFVPGRESIKYLGYDKANNVLVFETFSQTHPYDNKLRAPDGSSKVKWTQRIRLNTLKENLKNTEITLMERVKESLKGDVQVQCDCPSFRYWGYRYFLTNSNSVVGAKSNDIGFDKYFINRSPIPQRRQGGITCKHLDAVLRILPFNTNSITSSIERAKII
jgi:hypothetical protein